MKEHGEERQRDVEDDNTHLIDRTNYGWQRSLTVPAAGHDDWMMEPEPVQVDPLLQSHPLPDRLEPRGHSRSTMAKRH